MGIESKRAKMERLHARATELRIEGDALVMAGKRAIGKAKLRGEAGL